MIVDAVDIGQEQHGVTETPRQRRAIVIDADRRRMQYPVLRFQRQVQQHFGTLVPRQRRLLHTIGGERQYCVGQRTGQRQCTQAIGAAVADVVDDDGDRGIGMTARCEHRTEQRQHRQQPGPPPECPPHRGAPR